MWSSLLKTLSTWTEQAEVRYIITKMHKLSYTCTHRKVSVPNILIYFLGLRRTEKKSKTKGIVFYLFKDTAHNLLRPFLSTQGSLLMLLLTDFNTASTSQFLRGDITAWLLLLFWFPAGVNVSSLAPQVHREFHPHPIKWTSLLMFTSRASPTGLMNAKLVIN